MMALCVALALLAALGNALASVLQRRAAAVEDASPKGRLLSLSWLAGLVHRPVWLWGTGALVLSGLCQAGALAAGPLAVVQPVMTTELLFTLGVGSVVFRRAPAPGTWLAFAAMGVGLSAFLVLADPSEGRPTVPGARWPEVAVPALVAVAVLVAVSTRLRPAPRAAVLGTATAIGFSFTATLMKDAIGRLSDGVAAVFSTWQPYVTAAVGLASFLLLQAALRAGTLVASQPALTLGDSLLSVVLGAALFDETVTLGLRMLPEAAALALLVFGSTRLVRSPVVSGQEKEQMW
ncbi:DMT family transporter [Streptomyces sp. NPDC003077]|uniref:DMT family transporter n=1 Tax=Streptomyces sp. NPDC003077 TaxID=3154443 RepID=UPI0033A20E8A